MLQLSALALGPLLARAAPKIGSGNVDNSTTISQWLDERFSDPAGKLATVLRRTVDRAWLSLEIALAGEDLHRRAIDSEVDRALVEQIRQFISVAVLPILPSELRQRVRLAIRNARKAEKIPGAVSSANALAALTIRYLGIADDSLEIDINLLTELGLELRIAGYSVLADFFELRSTNQSPLVIAAVRYFLSREIAEDPRLLRDLRYTRIELLSEDLRTGFDRLYDALGRFTPVLIELLAELSSSIDVEDEAVALSLPDKPQNQDPGFYILGEHLIAPIRAGADGSRIAPCPVCMTNSVLNKAAEAWVSLRCTSCGTEFQATDGTVPPPSPPPVPKPVAGSKPVQKTTLAKNLQLWIDSGGPSRWIDYHKGIWSDTEFFKLTDVLRTSRFWPLDPNDVRKVLSEMMVQYRTRGAIWGTASRGAIEPPPPSTARGLVRTSDVYRTIDGNVWVPCPLCRSFNVQIPPRSGGEICLTCSGCWRTFLVELNKIRPRVLPPHPASPPSIWGKIRKWFGA